MYLLMNYLKKWKGLRFCAILFSLLFM
jgi:hypothetical protein